MLFLIGLTLCGLLVALTIKMCRAYGWVAQPRTDRWNQRTPCLFGGVPIWLTCVVLSLVFLPSSNRPLLVIVGASSLMFLLGFADDFLHLRPLTKLLGQFVVALVLVKSGIVYPLQQNGIINVVVSILWIIGITNAFNLLDNMDGLAAGVALISAIYLIFFFVSGGYREQATLYGGRWRATPPAF